MQAAIASLHADEPRDWPQIAALYASSRASPAHPSSSSAARSRSPRPTGPEAGLAIVDRLPLDDYRYLHATRGELLRRLGRTRRGPRGLRRALALVHDDAERRLLERRLAELDA